MFLRKFTLSNYEKKNRQIEEIRQVEKNRQIEKNR